MASRLPPRLQHGVDERRDEGHRFQDDQDDRQGEQNEDDRSEPPVGSFPYVGDQLPSGLKTAPNLSKCIHGELAGLFVLGNQDDKARIGAPESSQSPA